jgi:hypothetical protein
MFEVGKLYRLKFSTTLYEKGHFFSRPLTSLEKGDYVMFLEYKTGNHKRCKVLFKNEMGWILCHKADTNLKSILAK